MTQELEETLSDVAESQALVIDGVSLGFALLPKNQRLDCARQSDVGTYRLGLVCSAHTRMPLDYAT